MAFLFVPHRESTFANSGRQHDVLPYLVKMAYVQTTTEQRKETN